MPDKENLKDSLFKEITTECQLHRPFAEISKIPTADVVLVVRCKDCAVPHNRWTGCPKLNGLITLPDFYCSYGERRK